MAKIGLQRDFETISKELTETENGFSDCPEPE
jgi:hypothetical protein